MRMRKVPIDLDVDLRPVIGALSAVADALGRLSDEWYAAVDRLTAAVAVENREPDERVVYRHRGEEPEVRYYDEAAKKWATEHAEKVERGRRLFEDEYLDSLTDEDGYEQ